jgi:hypothetical protein
MIAVAIGRNRATAGGGNTFRHAGLAWACAVQKKKWAAAYNAAAGGPAPSFAQSATTSHAQSADQ